MKVYNNYCGNENVTMYFYNEWSDPEIEFNGFRWSAPMVEGDLYNMMLDENIPDTGANLAAYINTHIEDFLTDCLYGLGSFDIDFIKKNAPVWFEFLRDSLAYPPEGGWRFVSDDDVIKNFSGVSFGIEDFVSF